MLRVQQRDAQVTNYLLAPTVCFLAAPVMMPRTSSSFIMRKSSPSILISVPEHLPNRLPSPYFTARGNSLPSSLVLPLPTEMISPSCGLSLAESGLMRPPRVVPASSTRRTRTRSCSGVNFVAILADSFHSYSVVQAREVWKRTSRASENRRTFTHPAWLASLDQNGTPVLIFPWHNT